MHLSVAAPPPAVDELSIDELSNAVIGLMRIWRCAGRRAGEGGLSALEMAALIGERELRLTELAELRNVDQSVVSRQIGDMQAHGLVCRRPDPDDRRAGLVRLTADGLLLLGRARAMRRDWLREALPGIPGSDVRTAVEVINALAASLADHHATHSMERPR